MNERKRTVNILYDQVAIIDFIEEFVEDLKRKFNVNFTVEYEFHQNYKARIVADYEVVINLYKIRPEQWNKDYFEFLFTKLLFQNSKIFLDDVRQRPDDTFIVLRNFDEFKEFIDLYGIPKFISFDHDLGAEKSGYDCAKYLVNYCLNKEYKLPLFKVHSQNPVGRENIEKLLNNYNRIFDNKS